MKNISENISSFNITGKNIKKIRISKKITQEQLCARMQVLGYQIRRSDISKLENGKHSSFIPEKNDRCRNRNSRSCIK